MKKKSRRRAEEELRLTLDYSHYSTTLTLRGRLTTNGRRKNEEKHLSTEQCGGDGGEAETAAVGWRLWSRGGRPWRRLGRLGDAMATPEAASPFPARRSLMAPCLHRQDAKASTRRRLVDAVITMVAKEAPWKESAGVSSKLKQLELELLNLEIVGKRDLSKVTSLMQKQAEIYRAISGKIDDLCQRMQDPCEPLGSEFRTQKQTDFLLEAFRLQQHASETGQKLMALQSKTGKARCGDDTTEGQASVAARRAIDLVRNTFKEIQRSLEIWLARIIGDLEGILARDGVSRAKDYFISSYPLVQQ
nr:uncharacterized protein LOC109152641 isoform X3 [Ipomoea batatas]